MTNLYSQASTSKSTPQSIPQNQLRGARSFDQSRSTRPSVPHSASTSNSSSSKAGATVTSSRRKPAPTYDTFAFTPKKPGSIQKAEALVAATPIYATYANASTGFIPPKRSISGPSVTSATTRRSHSNANIHGQINSEVSSSVPHSSSNMSNVDESLMGFVSRSYSASAGSSKRPTTAPDKSAAASPTLSSSSSLTSLLAPRRVGSSHGHSSQSPPANFQQSPTGYSPGGYASDTSQALSIDMKRLWSKPAAAGSDSERERDMRVRARVRENSESSNYETHAARAATAPMSSLVRMTSAGSRIEGLSPGTTNNIRSRSPVPPSGSRSQSHSSSTSKRPRTDIDPRNQHQTPTKLGMSRSASAGTPAVPPKSTPSSVSKGARELIDFLSDGPPDARPPLTPSDFDKDKDKDKKSRNVLRRRPSAKGFPAAATTSKDNIKGFSLSPQYHTTVFPTSPTSAGSPAVGLSNPALPLKIDSALRPPIRQSSSLGPSSPASTSSSNLTPARAVAEAYKQQELRRAEMDTILNSNTIPDAEASRCATQTADRRHSASVDGGGAEAQYAVYQNFKYTTSGRVVAVGGPENSQYKPPPEWNSTPTRKSHDTAADTKKKDKSRSLGRKVSMSLGGWKHKDRAGSGADDEDARKQHSLQERRSRQSLQERRSIGTKSNSKASSSKTAASVFEQSTTPPVPDSKSKKRLRLSLGDPTALRAGHHSPLGLTPSPSPKTKTLDPLNQAKSRKTEVSRSGNLRDQSPVPAPAPPAAAGKLWNLMKRISTGGLRDKYREDKPPPPVPELPQQYRPIPTPTHTPRAKVGGLGPRSNDGHDTVEDGGLLGRFMQSRPSLSLAHHDSPKSPSPARVTTLPPIPARPSTNTNTTAHSSSPNSSDVASSRFFHRPQSTRSSTSSYGEAPPVPNTHIGHHIIPPRELYRLNGENLSNSMWMDDEPVPANIDKHPLPALPSPEQEHARDDSNDWFVTSPVESPRPSLPFPPRRARKPPPKLLLSDNEDRSQEIDSPSIPSFSTDSPINTFGFGTKLHSPSGDLDAMGASTSINTSPSKVRPSLAALQISVPPAETPTKERKPNSATSYLLPLSDPGTRSVPPPRPSRSAMRPLPSGNSTPSTGPSSANPSPKTSAPSRSPAAGSQARHSPPGSAFHEIYHDLPDGRSSMSSSSRSRHTKHTVNRKSSGTLSFASVSTTRARPRSNSLGSASRPIIATFRENNDQKPLASKDASNRHMTEQEKAEIWDDLLERSDRAPGGTLHLGAGGLMSDQMSLRMSEYSVDY